ncbi:2614_t:CDS:2, partial [Dentiscutata erythropus]
SPVWGFTKFCKKTRLPQEGEITIGVRFNKVQFSSERVSTPLPLSQFPSELSKAWKAELNQPEISDVQFNFSSCDGTECSTLYARSSILSERSIYFKSMFQQGKWSESKKINKNGSMGSSIGRLLSKKSWNDWSLGKFRKVEDLLEVYKKLKYPNIYNTKTSDALVSSFSPAMTILLDSTKDLKT